MENSSASKSHSKCLKRRFSADFIRRQPEYQFLMASIKAGTFKPCSDGPGPLRDDTHLGELGHVPPRPATAALTSSQHRNLDIPRGRALARCASTIGFSGLSEDLASMTLGEQPRATCYHLLSTKPDEEALDSDDTRRRPVTTSGHVGFYESAASVVPDASSSGSEKKSELEGIDVKAESDKDDVVEDRAEMALSRSSGYGSASLSSLHAHHLEVKSETEKTSMQKRPSTVGPIPSLESRPRKCVFIHSDVEVYIDDSHCDTTWREDSVDVVASENAKAYKPEDLCCSTIQEEFSLGGAEGAVGMDATTFDAEEGQTSTVAARSRRLGVVHLPDQLAVLHQATQPNQDRSGRPSDTNPARKTSAASSTWNHLTPSRKMSSAPSQQSEAGRKSSSVVGSEGTGARRKVSTVCHPGGTSWYDPMLEKSTKYLRGKEPKFSQCAQYLKPTRPGLTRLQMSYTQTNTAHNDRVIFADLLITAHRKSIVLEEGVRSLERRLKTRREDITRATTFYDRYNTTTPSSFCLPPPRRRKTPGTVAQKKRERRKRIEQKNQDLKLGYTPTADTLTPPSSRDIARLTDCRYLRVHPDRLRLIRSQSHFL